MRQVLYLKIVFNLLLYISYIKLLLLWNEQSDKSHFIPETHNFSVILDSLRSVRGGS